MKDKIINLYLTYKELKHCNNNSGRFEMTDLYLTYKELKPKTRSGGTILKELIYILPIRN